MAITSRALDVDESSDTDRALLAGAVTRSVLKGPARFARDRLWDQPGFEAIGGIKATHDWRTLQQWNGSVEDDRFAAAGGWGDDGDDETNYNEAPRQPRPLPALDPALGGGGAAFPMGPVGSTGRRRGHGQSAWASLQQQQRRNVISANARDDDSVLGV